MTAPPPPRTALPATLAGAVGVLGLEAGGLAVLTAYLIVLDVTADKQSVTVAIALTAFAALGAAALGLLARALFRRSARARGPAVVVQLFLLATGGFLIQTGPAWLGVLLLLLAVATIVLIVLPPSTRALGLD
ncbi:hypothetical protein EV385_1807 [Krasilnikovia cinnamomea]|uniref:Uncharacterized protein n=1 Tax=Krasilnikovia cinnamomea TaxID=349313 RepID=A0A4V6MG36_9ACTN|nr:hypothetical protein [Krasilnikovia cinnamomea]RZU50046.1 hypothetical protein EV385_1807 [Krasilnikovia cinnamomea]